MRSPKRLVTLSSVSTRHLAQLEALHLAGRRARQLLDEVDALGLLEAWQRLRCGCGNLRPQFLVWGIPGPNHHISSRNRPAGVVGFGDHRGLDRKSVV